MRIVLTKRSAVILDGMLDEGGKLGGGSAPRSILLGFDARCGRAPSLLSRPAPR